MSEDTVCTTGLRAGPSEGHSWAEMDAGGMEGARRNWSSYFLGPGPLGTASQQCRGEPASPLFVLHH